ncbi:Rho GTPase-activating protein 39 isoform 2 [Mycena indigotica]|uniref:Rho GTPase-activating protein 39 isoform 2 n=1 Tax=Mycena indigotica TaxID=2126181 RepID=A0A8H6TEJ4_9AGAR|nr:Rho GTPase-activating protein 39 isoform 2 [Mycena indigotica]KAF7315281.1 Rho GTPase-activating protein 39 isoform 2 [Mycena indigotica]
MSATETISRSVESTPSTTPSPNRRYQKSFSSVSTNDDQWGKHFWVTLRDPQTQASFYACPATGQVSWDAPVNHFVLPPSAEGEWWELSDESRGGMPYYYQTRTGQTVWERPEAAFVIPLGILQNTALGRRLSQTTENFTSDPKQSYRRSRSYTGPLNTAQGTRRRSSSIDNSTHLRPQPLSNLPTIPGSRDATDVSRKSTSSSRKNNNQSSSEGNPRIRAVSSPHRSPPPQSLNAAVELLTSSQSESSHESPKVHPVPRRPIPAPPPVSPNARKPTASRKMISAPILNHAATLQMSPVKNRVAGNPIPVAPRVASPTQPTRTIGTRTHPILPQALASDIQQFSESEYARRYFSTHRTGFIFRRRVPVAQMMQWQKTPLNTPLLTLRRSLHRDAVKIFKVIQHIMGDRDRDKPVGVRLSNETPAAPINASSTSLVMNGAAIIEEERWLLGEGLAHGELRDEVFCQLMKQLTANPSAESLFKGWQLLCVLLVTFPPSKNFEAYLRLFIQQHTAKSEGRVDIMAKYCLKKLAYIAKKGPRGKPPMASEIETASDAAFNPSTFGESLDAIFRLQERTYPSQKIPIILPFLADGILALGGTKSEGIFRVPGDNDAVSELKLRIDKGYYTLDGVDDPHVLASLMKLWLRELCDPLVPEEMYNECITSAKDVVACLGIVERLPTINRRVILFMISFLQLFLEDKVQVITKMTPANIALVMAPNVLRCNSDSMSVVFTNAQYEQLFVYHLLLNLNCGATDESYKPVHGLTTAKSAPRRPGY